MDDESDELIEPMEEVPLMRISFLLFLYRSVDYAGLRQL